MKKCRTYRGLLSALKNGEKACLEYTDMSVSPDGGTIVYLKNGTNLIVSKSGYEEIVEHLVAVQ